MYTVEKNYEKYLVFLTRYFESFWGNRSPCLAKSIAYYFPLGTDKCAPHENIKPNRIFEKNHIRTILPTLQKR